MLVRDSKMSHLKGFKPCAGHSKGELIPQQKPCQQGEGESCHQKEVVSWEGGIIAAVMLSQEPVARACRDKPGRQNGITTKYSISTKDSMILVGLF